MQKFLLIISVVLLVVTLLIIVLYPLVSPIMGIVSLLFSLSFSTYTIIKTHKGIEHARAKILKEVGVMVITLVIVLFLGGIAGILANAQVSLHFGELAGLLSAMGASFGVGYLVRVGVGRVIR